MGNVPSVRGLGSGDPDAPEYIAVDIWRRGSGSGAGVAGIPAN